jgi:hypothetical protein
MNLYQKINTIKKGAAPVQKDVTVGTGRASYQAISHDAVLRTVNDLMIANNVISYVSNITDDTERTSYQATDYKGNPAQKFKTFTKVKMIVTFVNGDQPEEMINIHSIGHADDPSDKAAGKAYSYAIKYAYLKLFGLSTGINDEQRHDYNQQPQQQTNMQPPQFQQQGYQQR